MTLSPTFTLNLPTFSKYSNALTAFYRNTGKPHPSTAYHSLRKRESSSISLKSEASLLWYGEITVGSQTFTVDFDTGSSDLILPGSNCTEHCTGHTPYIPNSKESVKTSEIFTITYGDGSTIRGNVFTDSVTLGGITASHQAIGVATAYSVNLDAVKFR
jgi:cathepsin D